MGKKKYKYGNEGGALEACKGILTLLLVILSYYLIQALVSWVISFAELSVAVSVKLIISAALWLVSVAVSAVIRRKNAFEEYRFIIKKGKKQPWAVILCCLMAFFLGIAMNYAVGFFVNLLPVPESWIEANQESVRGLYDHGGPVEVFLAIYVLVPLAEEMVFRGKGFRAMENSMGVAAATLISALAFAVAHRNILQGIYAFAAALVFAFIIEKSGSLATAVFAHAGFNISGPFIEAFCKNVDDIYLTVGAFAMSVIAVGGIMAAGSLAEGEKTEEDPEDDEFSEYESLD